MFVRVLYDCEQIPASPSRSSIQIIGSPNITPPPTPHPTNTLWAYNILVAHIFACDVEDARHDTLHKHCGQMYNALSTICTYTYIPIYKYMSTLTRRTATIGRLNHRKLAHVANALQFRHVASQAFDAAGMHSQQLIGSRCQCA